MRCLEAFSMPSSFALLAFLASAQAVEGAVLTSPFHTAAPVSRRAVDPPQLVTVLPRVFLADDPNPHPFEAPVERRHTSVEPPGVTDRAAPNVIPASFFAARRRSDISSTLQPIYPDQQHPRTRRDLVGVRHPHDNLLMEREPHDETDSEHHQRDLDKRGFNLDLSSGITTTAAQGNYGSEGQFVATTPTGWSISGTPSPTPTPSAVCGSMNPQAGAVFVCSVPNFNGTLGMNCDKVQTGTLGDCQNVPLKYAGKVHSFGPDPNGECLIYDKVNCGCSEESTTCGTGYVPQCGAGDLSVFKKAPSAYQGVGSGTWDGQIMSWRCGYNATFLDYEQSSHLYQNGVYIGNSYGYDGYGAASALTPSVLIRVMPAMALLFYYFV